jgi:hypothetical protein
MNTSYGTILLPRHKERNTPVARIFCNNGSNQVTPGDRLRVARHLFAAAHPREGKRDYTQDDLGTMAGFATQTWGNFESGVKPLVRISTLEQIEAFFRSAGMPYVTRIWLEHGVSKPGDRSIPELLAGPVTLRIPQPEEEMPTFPKASVGKKLASVRKKENPRKKKKA